MAPTMYTQTIWIHLRLLTDDTGGVVWRAEYDPYGQAMVDEDPDGDGQDVVFNVRFPGQYFDQESGFHYNYFRDYSPQTGRYVQSDPIGLEGGINTYLYAAANPVVRIDPYGLRASYCFRPLGNTTGQNGSGPPVFNHQFICITQPDGTVRCDSTNNPGGDRNPFWPDPGVPSDPADDNENTGQCFDIDDDENRCFESCVERIWAQPRPNYAIGPGGTDCQEYSWEILRICTNECGSLFGEAGG